MKKIYVFLLSILFLQSFSQAPKLINYQGVVRSGSGLPVTSPVKLKFDIYPVSSGGTSAFTEVQSTTTNSLGLFSTQIGKTVPLNLNWSSGSWYLELSVDTTNTGNSFVTIGRQQMVSVPFALYAESAGSAPSPPVTFSNNILYVGTNSVSLPPAPVYFPGNGIAINSGTIINTAPNQTVSITGAGNAVVNGPYPDFTVTATPQILSINNNVISLSNGGGAVTLPATSTTPNTSLTATGIATVTSSGTNTFNIAVAQPTITGSGGTTVGGVYPNLVISSPTVAAAVTPTINGNGIAVVTPTSGNFFNVSVPAPSLAYGSNVLSITQGTSSSAVTIPAGVTPTLTGTGVANTSSAGNNFTVNVPAPALSIGGTALTVTQGTASSTVLLPAPLPTTITASGVAVVTPTSGNNFNVNVPGPAFTYNNISGQLTLTQGATTFSGIVSPMTSVSGNTLTVGGSTVNIPFWSLSGNTGTNANNDFIGTTDNIPLNFRVNNQRSGRIDPLLSNTFFGYWSGKNNTSGTQNTAYGINSLQSNSVGIGNTAIGTSAMDGNTTGANNTALGMQALMSNSTGSLNTASGYQSLYSNTTGSVNAAFGANALLNNTTGYYNAAMGEEALRNNTNGSSNTGMGAEALFWNNGSNNAGIGFGVMQNNSTGSNNTAVGAVAGYNSTGSGNVFLGFAAGYNATGSNQLHIANSSSGLPLVYGDFSTGRIGLGNTSPVARLDVTGTSQFIDNATTSGYSTLIQNNIGSGISGGALEVTSSGQRSIGNSAMSILNLVTKSGGSGSTKTGLSIQSTGSWAPGTSQSNVGLSVNVGGADINNSAIFMGGNVGIGTTSPVSSSSLHVNGGVTITDGTQGAGRVLTSDPSGNASWKQPTIVTPIAFGNHNINSVSTTPTLLQSALGSFTKSSPDTRVEVIVQTNILVADLLSTSGVVYEIRLNGTSPLSNTGRVVYFADNNGSFTSINYLPVNITAEFSTLAPGTYNVELWVSTVGSGTANTIHADPGNYSTSSAIVKEFR